MNAQSFHIIGHSLGGQAAGYAGERIENLGRITGQFGVFVHYSIYKNIRRVHKTQIE